LAIAVTAAIRVQPAGAPVAVTEPPLSARQATSTSPAAVPVGLVTTTELVAVALTTVDVVSRLMPAPGGGGGGGVVAVVNDQVFAAAIALPAASLTPVVTVAVYEVPAARSAAGSSVAVREAPS
jgi:hypothetical protein